MRPDPTVSTHGVLRPGALGRELTLTRHEPAEDVGFFVERYWIVRWDLRDRAPHTQETLPHPSVNVVVERGKSGVFGIPTRRFQVVLEGRGQVVAAKLKPGAFRPFTSIPMTQMRDRVLPLREILDSDADELETRILDRDLHSEQSDLDREQIQILESALRRHLPKRDEGVSLVGDVIRIALAKPEITKVEDLVAAHGGMSFRAMQRLFRDYVGMTPKWVIRRFRMHEATARVAEGGAVDWARLATELGYFDQAHFIRDFRAQIGSSPTEYAAACAEKRRAR